MKTKETPFIFSPNMSPFINHELEKDSQYHPNLGGITQGGMANHFPMTVLSLQGLGASDSEVTHFINNWADHRALIEDNLELSDRHQVTRDNWTKYLGQTERLLEFKRVFLECLTHQNALGFISDALFQMKNALPMGLFHPLIRLSFAMIHQDKGFIADALAYMAIRYQDLYQTNTLTFEAESTLTAQDIWLKIEPQLGSLKLKQVIYGGSLHISEQLCSEKSVQDLAIKPLNISRSTLQQRIKNIAELALRLYLYQPALTTLHGVTACQALADITQKCLTDKTQKIFDELWRRYWVWLTGLYIEKGSPSFLPQIDPELETEIVGHSWDDLAAQARQIPEVHLIKMVFSCQWFDQHFGPNPLYKLAVVNMLKEKHAHFKSKYGYFKSEYLK